MKKQDGNDHMRIADALLVIRCQLGERRAFDELAERWAPPIAGYARQVSSDSDAAAELTQDIWLRVLRGIDKVEDPERFRSWVFGIAHRAFVDTLRRRYRASTHIDIETVATPEASTPDDGFDPEIVERALIGLGPAEREILNLFYLQELTIEEAAEALSIPSGTVKSRLHRARRAMREQLEREI